MPKIGPLSRAPGRSTNIRTLLTSKHARLRSFAFERHSQWCLNANSNEHLTTALAQDQTAAYEGEPARSMSSQTETENTLSGYTGREEELQLYYIRGIDFLAHHNNTAKELVVLRSRDIKSRIVSQLARKRLQVPKVMCCRRHFLAARCN